jgi:hypothetical protein
MDSRTLTRCLAGVRALLPAFALALCLSPASPLSGQSVKGRLLDGQSGAPISAADLVLLAGTEGDRIVSGGQTDSLGSFLIEGRTEGRFRLKAERLGYRSVTSPPFDLTVRDTLEVELRMSVEAILLAPLTVVSKRVPLVFSQRLASGGFVERKDIYGKDGMGSGHFLERSDWENRTPHRLAEIVREVPGVRIVGGREIRLRSVTSLGEPWGCVPMYYLDGALFRLGAGESIEAYVSPLSISAIEVYPGLSRPPQFMDMGEKACGAIVIWTG